jgi:hypothetical protein
MKADENTDISVIVVIAKAQSIDKGWGCTLQSERLLSHSALRAGGEVEKAAA